MYDLRHFAHESCRWMEIPLQISVHTSGPLKFEDPLTCMCEFLHWQIHFVHHLKKSQKRVKLAQEDVASGKPDGVFLTIISSPIKLQDDGTWSACYTVSLWEEVATGYSFLRQEQAQALHGSINCSPDTQTPTSLVVLSLLWSIRNLIDVYSGKGARFAWRVDDTCPSLFSHLPR